MISVKLLRVEEKAIEYYNAYILQEILISKSVYNIFKELLDPDKKRCINIKYPTSYEILQDVLYISNTDLNDIQNRISIMTERLKIIMKLSNTNNCVTVELISDIFDLNNLESIIKKYFESEDRFNLGIVIDLVY